MRVEVAFRGGVILAQGIKTPQGDALDARVDFDLRLPDQVVAGLQSRVRVSPGGTYEHDALEVELPVGYEGPWNHQAFAACAQRYVEQLVGSQGRMIRIEGATDVVLKDVYLGMAWSCSFDAEDPRSR